MSAASWRQAAVIGDDGALRGGRAAGARNRPSSGRRTAPVRAAAIIVVGGATRSSPFCRRRPTCSRPLSSIGSAASLSSVLRPVHYEPEPRMDEAAPISSMEFEIALAQAKALRRSRAAVGGRPPVYRNLPDRHHRQHPSRRLHRRALFAPTTKGARPRPVPLVQEIPLTRGLEVWRSKLLVSPRCSPGLARTAENSGTRLQP